MSPETDVGGPPYARPTSQGRLHTRGATCPQPPSRAPREPFPVTITGLTISPAAPGLWRVARADGAVLGHIERARRERALSHAPPAARRHPLDAARASSGRRSTRPSLPLSRVGRESGHAATALGPRRRAGYAAAMQWWNDLMSWLTSSTARPTIFAAVVLFIAVLAAGLLAAWIAAPRSSASSRSAIARRRRRRSPHSSTPPPRHPCGTP